MISGHLIDHLYDASSCRSQFLAVRALASSLSSSSISITSSSTSSTSEMDVSDDEGAVALQRTLAIVRQMDNGGNDDCYDLIAEDFTVHRTQWSEQVYMM